MPTLQGLDGRSLVPNTLDTISKGFDVGGQVASDLMTQGLIEKTREGDIAARDWLAGLNPAALQSMFAGESMQAETKKQQFIQQATQERDAAIRRKAQAEMILQGEPESLGNNIRQWVLAHKDDDDFDMSEARELSNLSVSDPQAARRMLENVILEADSDLSIANQILTSPSDLTASQRERGSLLRDLESTDENVRNSAEVSLGLRARPSTASAQVTDIGGVPHVFDPRTQTMVPVEVQGEIVTAESVGESEGVIAEQKEFATLTGRDRANAIDDGFNTIATIDSGIRTIDRAITELENGANTGFIEQFFPSIASASVRLDSLAGQFTLDTINSVTLGAISEKELALARAVGIPTGLQEDELKDYLTERREAQSKLRNYYYDQIDHLDQGGTISSFLRLKRREMDESPRQSASSGDLIYNPETGRLE